jgi:hypothetical protein
LSFFDLRFWLPLWYLQTLFVNLWNLQFLNNVIYLSKGQYISGVGTCSRFRIFDLLARKNLFNDHLAASEFHHEDNRSLQQ